MLKIAEVQERNGFWIDQETIEVLWIVFKCGKFKIH